MRAARLENHAHTTSGTIAGEAYAADDAIDRAYHTNCVMTEIISGEKTGPKLLHVHATVCRSLFDAVISANPSTEEKRVLMAVRAIQEALDPKWFRWVPTGLMVADVLTKDSDGPSSRGCESQRATSVR